MLLMIACVAAGLAAITTVVRLHLISKGSIDRIPAVTWMLISSNIVLGAALLLLSAFGLVASS